MTEKSKYGWDNFFLKSLKEMVEPEYIPSFKLKLSETMPLISVHFG